ncbi:MAG: polymer-forming cytoskeletal protein [Woeseia sp.]|nr:polymer-forming cytoskeletal protein [Woeseia sp.]MBT8095831.1 polymer-forming cytoskeletal protein [Woeseia sp.]NNE61719.1 polymer-forming cytoskeletal protein [Woeseia sp.]NNL55085.1 polymer-forming cytoskeletal protein [Woeseia sp.]
MKESKQRRLRDVNSGPPTLISENCKITGTIEGGGNFMVSGEVFGDSDLAGTVTLTRKGFWKGTLKAAAVIVAGRVEGEVVSDGRIEIGETANIDGRVIGGEIAVAAGAIVQGTMRTTVAAAPVEFIEKRDKN